MTSRAAGTRPLPVSLQAGFHDGLFLGHESGVQSLERPARPLCHLPASIFGAFAGPWGDGAWPQLGSLCQRGCVEKAFLGWEEHRLLTMRTQPSSKKKRKKGRKGERKEERKE